MVRDVLFIGFTNMCSQLNAIEVMGMLNKMFVRFDKLTKEHGLFKVETIGDAYMVVGGIPTQVPDHAQRVCRVLTSSLRIVCCHGVRYGGVDK